MKWMLMTKIKDIYDGCEYLEMIVIMEIKNHLRT